MNEEEIKNKVALPYLQSLGLNASDLDFEKSFSLQIGRNKVLVDGREPKRGSVGGRLDTLVKRNGTNLLILEFKEGGHALTNDDRDQAVSYARLVHPIAPYTLVTNGTDWKLFDAITRDELRPEQVVIKDRYQLALPNADREAALEFFLGYSAENLLRFCQVQVAEQLKPLAGSPQDLGKKYIKKLTLPRMGFLDEYALFEKSEANGLLLLAESGSGKTSALCDLALRRLDAGRPTVFFSGLMLEKGLPEAMAEEFGWVFSEQLSPTSLLRRLSSLTHNDPLVVIVDAIDEWSYGQKAQNLVSLLRGSRGLHIKFVLSCRTAAWEAISQPLGTDIGFGSYLFSRPGSPQSSEPYLLRPMTDKEFYQAVEKYRQVFGVWGAFEDGVLDEARRNPFLLRVMFAVAAEHQQEHLTFSSREFFDRYHDLLLRKCVAKDRSAASAQIHAVAAVMFETNMDLVSDTEVRKHLGLSVNESLLPALFEQNILQRRGDDYAFYFQHLRSYVIAFRVREWHRAEPAELEQVKRDGVQGEALGFYLRYATAQQLEVVAAEVWKNAHEYLDTYRGIIVRHFPALDHEFVPGDEPDLGLVAEYVTSKRMLGGFGFRRRKPDDSPVVLIPVDRELSKSSNLMFLAGTRRYHATSSGIGNNAQAIRKAVVELEIIVRANQAIRDHHLSLHGCGKVAEEMLINAICGNSSIFPQFFDPHSGQMRFPISTAAVNEALLRAELHHHFTDEVIDDKRHHGLIEENWTDDGRLSYSPILTHNDEQRIEAAVEHVMQTGKRPTKRSILVNTEKIRQILGRTDWLTAASTVQQPPWMTGYQIGEAIREQRSTGMDLLRNHVGAVYKAFLDSYRTVIDLNFPTLKDAFALRSIMPLRLYVDVNSLHPRGHQAWDGRIVVAYEKIDSAHDNEVVMCDESGLEMNTDGRANVKYHGQHVSDTFSINYNVGGLMYSMGVPLVTRKIFKKIEEEWSHAADQLRHLEGIRAKWTSVPGRRFRPFPCAD